MLKSAILAATVLLALAPLRAFAQDTDPTANCERAWLASDWPTVAIYCTSVADNRERSAKTYLADIAVDPGAPVAIDAEGLVGPEYLVAGEARARASVAYSHLKRGESAHNALDGALTDLREATSYSVLGETRDRAIALLDFVGSGTFVADAPESVLMAAL